MNNTLKNILVSFAISVILIGLEFVLQSNFLSNFLKNNLVGLLLTLLAINTATSSVISSKLEEISQRTGANFQEVIKEVKIALIEQIILIALSVLLLIVLDSKKIDFNIFYLKHIVNVFLCSILVYAIDILRDTGVTIFNIIIELNKKDE
jgi:hypothetical protein